MERQWSYLQNPFLNVAGDNFTLFNDILKYTNDRLATQAGNAFFDDCIALVNPVYIGWKTIFDNWNTSDGAHKAATLAFTNKLTDLSGNDIELWDIKIQNVYRKGTPEYMHLLPHNRIPFQTGTQEHRIEAVGNLISAIGTDASLAAVKALVITFNTALTGAKTAQTTALTNTDNLSKELKILIPIAATTLYKVLGKMMDQFAEAPSVIESYFDLENIRKAEQVSFTKTVKPKKDANICKRKLVDTDMIKVVNDGVVDIWVYYAAEKNDDRGVSGKLIAAGEEATFPASEAGNLTTGHYLKAYNPDALNEGHIILTIIK